MFYAPRACFFAHLEVFKVKVIKAYLVIGSARTGGLRLVPETNSINRESLETLSGCHVYVMSLMTLL